MRGIVVDQDSGQPTFIDTLEPHPKSNEVLISIKAASVNGADLWQKRGRYSIPQGVTPILGLDFAGVIIAVGNDVKRRKVGERVMGIVGGGGQAECLAIHEDLAMVIPEELSYEEAAALPEVFITAFQTLKWQGELVAGQRVLIHGGASGVGTASIQLARILGAIPYVTAGSHEKCSFCLDLGAEEAINYREEEFSERILERTNGEGCNVIVDIVGASFFQKNLRALAKGGTIILLSVHGGSIVEKFDLSQLFDKWARIIGTTIRFRSFEYKQKLIEDFSSFALPLFAKGRLKPVIFKILPWEEVLKAHSLLEQSLAIGKVVLKIAS